MPSGSIIIICRKRLKTGQTVRQAKGESQCSEARETEEDSSPSLLMIKVQGGRHLSHICTIVEKKRVGKRE